MNLYTIDVYCKLCGDHANRAINIIEADLTGAVAQALKAALCIRCKKGGITHHHIFECDVQGQTGELSKETDPFWQKLMQMEKDYCLGREDRKKQVLAKLKDDFKELSKPDQTFLNFDENSEEK